MRRKRIRQKLAQERDEILCKEQKRQENSPRYQAWISEQRALELFAQEEEDRLSAERNAAWMAEEARAQKEWKERQERLAVARAERAKQELRIKEEWEEEQRKVKAAKKEQERIAEEKQRKQEEVLKQIENFLNTGRDMPPEANVASVTNPDRPPCPFFMKTGACRFGDRCSRNHTRPAISRVLLVPNFYDHIGLRQMNPDELEAADDWLEYEDSETYHHFLDFYEDVLPEWERFGRISQFKVCCNLEPHLRGNVYVEYESAHDAVQAFKLFHGRFYGGKQINVEFVNIDSWKAAICGQFHKRCCPKGRACNFLHVFRNPGNAFNAADRDQQEWRCKQHRPTNTSPNIVHDRSWSESPEHNSRRNDWRWSESPSPPMDASTSKTHHTHSERTHRSERSRRSERDTRGGNRSSSKRNDSSSERSRHREKRRRHNDRDEASYHSDWRDSRRSHRPYHLSTREGDSMKPPMECDRETRDLKQINVHSKGREEAPCALSDKKLNRHTFFNSGSDEELSTPVSEQKQVKEKKPKKKKKKDSHRKEKRRKKRSHSRSSSNSSTSEK